MTPTTAIVVVLVLAPIAGVLVATSPASGTTQSCGQSVDYSAFRSTDAIEAMNRTGEATAARQNTEVTLTEATGFIRLTARNPNGYCVAYTVEISSEIVPPADLGTITSNSETAEASWMASQNLSSGAVYTRVTFTLPPGSNATFAPSKIRVQTLSWTGTARKKASETTDIFDDIGLSSLFGEEKLDQRTYEIRPTASSSRITIPLENGSRQIEGWQATYTVDGQTRPVRQDASAPVFYTESPDAVTFHFSERAVEEGASVEFTAEPGPIERLGFSAKGYFSGTPFDGVLDGLLGAAGVPA